MRAVAFILGAVWVCACGVGRADAALRDGDLIFQTSQSGQSLAIQRATGSRYSHMGLIVFRDGAPFVFEASATVRFTPLATFIERGEDGHYVVKRIKDADQRLTPAVLDKARAVARTYAGKKYDLTFEWSDERMYCSELVWKIYKQALGVEIGPLQKLREFRLDDPAVKAKLHERYGESVPLDEPVISPAAMFAWPGLETVVEERWRRRLRWNTPNSSCLRPRVTSARRSLRCSATRAFRARATRKACRWCAWPCTGGGSSSPRRSRLRALTWTCSRPRASATPRASRSSLRAIQPA
jgi:hypothetical protein